MRFSSMGRKASMVAVAAAALLGACDSDSTGGDDNPKVTVRLTDAAGDVKAAVVTISEIYLEGSGGTKTTLSSQTATTDLVSHANDAVVLVDGVEVPAGTYNALRFVVTGAYIEVDDGAGGSKIFASSPSYAGLPAGVQIAGTLELPALAATGLSVTFANSADLAISGDRDLLVDFDVSQSFDQQTNTAWIMTPAITGAETSAASTVTASISLGTGVALPPINGTAVTLAAFQAELNGEMLDFADPDGDGTFQAQFKFVMPGQYTLRVVQPVGLTITTNPSLPVNVTVGQGEESSVAFTVMTAAIQ